MSPCEFLRSVKRMQCLERVEGRASCCRATWRSSTSLFSAWMASSLATNSAWYACHRVHMACLRSGQPATAYCLMGQLVGDLLTCSSARCYLRGDDVAKRETALTGLRTKVHTTHYPHAVSCSKLLSYSKA